MSSFRTHKAHDACSEPGKQISRRVAASPRVWRAISLNSLNAKQAGTRAGTRTVISVNAKKEHSRGMTWQQTVSRRGACECEVSRICVGRMLIKAVVGPYNYIFKKDEPYISYEMSPDQIFGPGAEPARLTEMCHTISYGHRSQSMAVTLLMQLLVGEPQQYRNKKKGNRCRTHACFIVYSAQESARGTLAHSCTLATVGDTCRCSKEHTRPTQANTFAG